MPKENKYGCTVWKNGHTVRRHNKKLSTVRKDDRIGVILKSIQPEEELQFEGNIIRKNMKQTVFGLTYDAAEILCELLHEELRIIKSQKMKNLQKELYQGEFAKERVIKDGKYAVVYSSDYGTGWFTHHHYHGATLTRNLMFHPLIVDMVLSGKQQEMTKNWFATNFPKLCKTTVIDVTAAENDSLKVKWIPVDASFVMQENNGKEFPVLLHTNNVFTSNS